MEEKYVFNPVTKELKTGGDIDPCLPGGIGKLLFEKLEMFAQRGRTAQIIAETGYEDSFTDFFMRCKKLAIYMQDIGIQQGDIISSCSPNNLNSSIPFISGLFIGAITASTDPILSSEDTTYLLNMTEPKLIFVSEECIDLIKNTKYYEANSNCKLIVLQKHDKYDNIPDILDRYTNEEAKYFEPVFIEDTTRTACILFSSGTTGLPKGTCLNHNYLNANVFTNKYIDLFDSKEHQNTILSFTTLYWISAVMINLSVCYYGLKKLSCSKFDAKTLWALVKKYKVNKLLMSYYHCIEGLETLKTPHLSLDHLMIMGGQISPAKQDQYGEMLPNAQIVNAYGMTETGSVSVNYDYKNRSSGKPTHKNQTIKIVDAETEQPLDLNMVGEIRVKHKFQMNGYYKKNSADCWDEDGFFKTGDVGYLTDEYELFVVDRIKEMFKYRSWHVLPAKIERHLVKHACLQHCVVIGVPNEEDDNHAMAIVVLKDNFTVSSEELLKYANDEMDSIHQIRAGVRIVAKHVIPYTITGKINRRLLKTQILSGKCN